eukprot:CAMPEP_0206604670 /NCGR_PEP_ID=MMETSP0325_2-20121206/49620_1 /ASSEMBLY_ACC=CAM_ASM_000347 /TAXON_ID=2866 /ORGANISM="Crypthecodinium cohnii, Strain Seligo" /LENGTH=66 /DNA_ID=CAMNT_0054119391 /DNA_START=21 /DNA_END=218 /DNA_ORIENTATION=+
MVATVERKMLKTVQNIPLREGPKQWKKRCGMVVSRDARSVSAEACTDAERKENGQWPKNGTCTPRA